MGDRRLRWLPLLWWCLRFVSWLWLRSRLLLLRCCCGLWRRLLWLRLNRLLGRWVYTLLLLRCW